MMHQRVTLSDGRVLEAWRPMPEPVMGEDWVAEPYMMRPPSGPPIYALDGKPITEEEAREIVAAELARTPSPPTCTLTGGEGSTTE